MLARVLIVTAIVVALATAIPEVLPSFLRSTATDGSQASTAMVAEVRTPVDHAGRATIYASEDGHFRAEAVIRGRRVPVVIDTGATVVALSEATARTIGVQAAARASRVTAKTANGVVEAPVVILPDVALGSIRISNVEAVVLPDTTLDHTLLGMSFLGRVKEWKATDGRLELAH